MILHRHQLCTSDIQVAPRLKKKQRVRAERGRGVQKAGITGQSHVGVLYVSVCHLEARPLVFLVSWANAQELAA